MSELQGSPPHQGSGGIRPARPLGIPIPPDGFTSNEVEARWLEQTVVLRTEQVLERAGIPSTINPVGLFELLLLCLNSASRRSFESQEATAGSSTCREAFERWAETNSIDTTRWEDGGYFEDETARLWSAWKGGRIWGDANR